MPRPVHFEIHADNPDRAITFYTSVFDWEFTSWAPPEGVYESPVDYWLITTGPENEPGINGGLMRRIGPALEKESPVASYVCTIGVENVDEYIDRIMEEGGKIVVAKMAVPTIGWLTYAKDTEGNLFGMMQADAKAK